MFLFIFVYFFNCGYVKQKCNNCCKKKLDIQYTSCNKFGHLITACPGKVQEKMIDNGEEICEDSQAIYQIYDVEMVRRENASGDGNNMI